MKNTVKIAFCGIISAIVCAFMALSVIPNITFAIPAIAGLFLISVLAETGYLWALSVYFVSAVISFFTANKTSWVLFVCLFGYYPILKPVIERIKKPVAEWIAKILLFNFVAAVCYIAGLLVLNFKMHLWIIIALLIVGNIAFLLYDISVSKIAAAYYLSLHKRISDIVRFNKK